MTAELEDQLRRAAHALPAAAPADPVTAAESAGLLDVAYATYDSPVGTLVLAATPAGLVSVAFTDGEIDPALEQLARTVSPRVLRFARRLDEPRRELDEYFAGRRRTFELPLDRLLMHGFVRRVLEVTARIPYGSVSTYGLGAAEAGSPRGSRAAGNALGANPIPIVVPCHRVVRTGGALGGYGGGPERKRILLEAERRYAGL
ncbi:MAG: methylated-DNA--[protein]-cysteine S-methyltransferase [Solirubrobacteraceae bacterium]